MPKSIKKIIGSENPQITGGGEKHLDYDINRIFQAQAELVSLSEKERENQRPIVDAMLKSLNIIDDDDRYKKIEGDAIYYVDAVRYYRGTIDPDTHLMKIETGTPSIALAEVDNGLNWRKPPCIAGKGYGIPMIKAVMDGDSINRIIDQMKSDKYKRFYRAYREALAAQYDLITQSVEQEVKSPLESKALADKIQQAKDTVNNIVNLFRAECAAYFGRGYDAQINALQAQYQGVIRGSKALLISPKYGIPMCLSFNIYKSSQDGKEFVYIGHYRSIEEEELIHDTLESYKNYLDKLAEQENQDYVYTGGNGTLFDGDDSYLAELAKIKRGQYQR